MVRLRSRQWFLARRQEVPLRLLRRWEKELNEGGALPLEEYLLAATTLNDDQLQSADDLLPRHLSPQSGLDYSRVYPARQALRLYAALAPGQQQALWAGRPIAAARMTAAQQALLLAAWEATEERRPQNAPDAAPLMALPPAAGFALSSENRIRVVERHGDSATLYSEPAPAAAAGPPGAARPAGAAPPAPGAPRVIRSPYTDLRLQLFTAPDQRREVDLQVATPR